MKEELALLCVCSYARPVNVSILIFTSCLRSVSDLHFTGTDNSNTAEHLIGAGSHGRHLTCTDWLNLKNSSSRWVSSVPLYRWRHRGAEGPKPHKLWGKDQEFKSRFSGSKSPGHFFSKPSVTFLDTCWGSRHFCSSPLLSWSGGRANSWHLEKEDVGESSCEWNGAWGTDHISFRGEGTVWTEAPTQV